MHPPTSPDLRIYAGDTFTQRVTVTANGEPVNLSDGRVDAHWRSGTLVVPFDVTVLEGGVLELALPPAQTRALGRTGRYDIQWARDGVVQTIARGTVVWMDDVTRIEGVDDERVSSRSSWSKSRPWTWSSGTFSSLDRVSRSPDPRDLRGLLGLLGLRVNPARTESTGRTANPARLGQQANAAPPGHQVAPAQSPPPTPTSSPAQAAPTNPRLRAGSSQVLSQSAQNIGQPMARSSAHGSGENAPPDG